MPNPAQCIAEVIQTMLDIQASLPDSDGLKWFNHLYLSVTQAVQTEVTAGTLLFSEPDWIGRLDVAFANLYFAALTAAEQGGAAAAPAAWRPLLSNRLTPRIARIQFALAGMNAHINRDLVFALLKMHGTDDAPTSTGPRFQDFIRVNQLLSQVESQVRAMLLVGTPLENGGVFAPLEDILTMLSVGEARHAAWNHSQSLWHVRGMPEIQSASLHALDGLTELASNGLLLRVLP